MYNFAPELDGHIRTSLKNMNQAESDLDYKWDIERGDEVTALGLSSDPIYSTLGAADDKKYREKASSAKADNELNDEIRFLQYQHHINSDPIYSSAGPEAHKLKTQAAKEVVPYPDPSSMKLDHEIVTSQDNLKNTEGRLKQKLEFKELM